MIKRQLMEHALMLRRINRCRPLQLRIDTMALDKCSPGTEWKGWPLKKVQVEMVNSNVKKSLRNDSVIVFIDIIFYKYKSFEISLHSVIQRKYFNKTYTINQ